jgi:hypothetical protein
VSSTRLARAHPIAAYFVLAYGIAWIGSIAAGGPTFIRGEPMRFLDGMLMFAPMLAGPSIAGILMTALVDGRAGLRDLWGRMRMWQVGPRWYAAAVLLYPMLILLVLGALTLASPAFAPNVAVMGIAVGLLTGFFEEIGWMGYVFPKMERAYGVLRAAVSLGLLHSTWHVVADYLGASTALGAYWLPHFVFFMPVSMTATRVLIVWVYQNTGSVFMAQAAHASSTGFLFMLAPVGLTPANDTLWYAVYGAVLWLVVAGVVVTNRGPQPD